MSGSPDREGATVLMVGGGEPMDLALHGALERHGVFVEAAEPSAATEAVLAAAPDVVLLVGDAAKDGGVEILRQLASSPATAHTPVAVLAAEWPFAKRFDTYRRGAAAVLARDASVDGLARKIAELARKVLDRPGEPFGDLGEATLDELVTVVSQSLRTAIAPSGDPAATRLVLGAGRSVTDALGDFVDRIRGLVSGVEAVHWELGSAPRPRPALGDVEGDDATETRLFEGLRILLVVYDPGRGDTLTHELRARGAIVALTDGAGRGLETARTLVPEVALVDAARVPEPNFEILRALRRDPRLRWTSILVALKDEIWTGHSFAPNLARLASRLAPLLDADRTLRERAVSGSFETRLEVTGPWRLLRTLAAAEGTLHVSVETSQATVDLDVGGGLIVGVQAFLKDGKSIEGSSALAVLLAGAAGRVRVSRRVHPSLANLVVPVELALAGAANELPSRPPSSPGVALDLPRLEPTPTTTRRAEPAPPPRPPARMDETPPPKATLVFHPPRVEVEPEGAPLAVAAPVAAAPVATSRSRTRMIVGAASLGVVCLVVVIAVALAAGGSDDRARAAPTALASHAPASTAPEPTTAAAADPADSAEADAEAEEDGTESPEERAAKRERANTLLKRAARMRAGGQIPQAEKLYMQVLQFDPRNYRAAEELARIYLQRRRGAGAVEWAERAVRRRPGSAPLRVLLGDAYKLAGDPARAERQWRAALRMSPRNREARQRLGE